MKNNPQKRKNRGNSVGKRPVDALKYWGVRAAAGIAWRMPAPLLYRLADAAGDAVYWGWGRGRRNTTLNMRHVLGRETPAHEVRRVARHSFRNYLRLMADFAYSLNTPAAELTRRVHVTDWEPLDAAIRRGRGTILIGLHMGNWDLAGVALASRGYPIHAVMESFASPQVDRLIRSTREAWGIRCIPLHGAMRPLFKALRRNEIVALVTDRPAGDDGTVVNFFGAPSSWPTGPATLALRTGAQIVPGYLIRQPDNTFVGRFLSLPPLDLTDDQRQNVRLLTQAIVTTLEEPIREHPEQWFMFRKMWDDEIVAMD